MISNNIYKFRKQRGISLSELAERAKISKSYISNIERNLNSNPSIKVIEKISSVLQVDLSVLINSEREEVTPLVEEEWIHFINELKAAGIKIDDIRSNTQLMEYIKWRQENFKGNNK